MRYILLGLLVGFMAYDMVNAKPSVGPQCFNKDEVMKYIEDNKFQTLFQSITPDGQTLEALFTPLLDQETIIIQYGSGKYCLMSKTNKTKMNDSSIDILHNTLEKYRGTRT
jgi:hypothetical protein